MVMAVAVLVAAGAIVCVSCCCVVYKGSFFGSSFSRVSRFASPPKAYFFEKPPDDRQPQNVPTRKGDTVVTHWIPVFHAMLARLVFALDPKYQCTPR